MIYLLRHGEIEGAGTRRFVGQVDVKLSQTGMEQAHCWNNFFNGMSFDIVVSSSLSRAVKTAEIVSNLTEDAIVLNNSFNEINLGQWDGKTFSQIRSDFPEAWADRGNDLANYRPPGGESFSDLSRRVLPAFIKITASFSGNILIAGHAGVNRVILCNLLKKPLDKLFQIPQDYGAMSLIDNIHGNLIVKEVNNSPGPPC